MEPIGQTGVSEAEEMRALGRDVGRRGVERLGAGMTRLVEETSALYRWALTMLVLLNAGGLCLSLLARDSLGPDALSQVALTFFGGMMMALLAALVGLALTVPLAGAMRRAMTDWTEVSLSGELSDAATTSARYVRRMGTVWIAAMGLVGLIALALFAAGALMLGERLGIFGPASEPAAAVESVAPEAAANSTAPAIPLPDAAAPPVSAVAPASSPATRPVPSQTQAQPRAATAAPAPSARTERQASPPPVRSAPARTTSQPASANPAPPPAASSPSVPSEAPLLSPGAPTTGN
ncbi:hypothetical protein [Sphingobium sp. B8D3B]|uniref:hypothetical protein n=1 Tax=Sphingobium sp. B8D3B TaxID=2940585 RepID=UPI0022248E36|nr:hypothetical protein [Sphingobium sp. B8D3B]MCW2396716.1 hypothetical protein [Sphingobium sp. B8D3B]